VAGGSVLEERISPDASRVVYAADQDTDDVFELYSVPIDGSAASVKLNGPLVAGGGVVNQGIVLPVRISPDSSRVAYVADADLNQLFELYCAPIDGSALPTKLVALSGSRDVVDFLITPDSAQVIYRADQDVNEVYELYGVLLDGSGAPVKLNAPLVPGADVGTLSGRLEFAFSAASNRVVYQVMGSLSTDLYSVPNDGSQVAIQLNGLGGAGITGNGLELSPDGLWVAYASFLTQDGPFVAPVDGSRPARRVGGPMVSGGHVALFAGFTYTFSSDSRFLVYPADQETNEVTELFLGSITKPICRVP